MTLTEILYSLARGLVVTVEIAVGAWILSVLAGVLLGTLQDLGPGWAKWAVRVLVTVLRSVPQLVMLYLFYFGIGSLGLNVPAVLAAIVALGLTESAFATEYYRAALMTVSPEQREAGKSLGLSELKVFVLIVIPQAVPYALAPLLNSFISLAKLATLAAAVGSPEILYTAQSMMQLTGEITMIIFLVILFYIVFSVPLSRLVRMLEARVEHR